MGLLQICGEMAQAKRAEVASAGSGGGSGSGGGVVYASTNLNNGQTSAAITFATAGTFNCGRCVTTENVSTHARYTRA